MDNNQLNNDQVQQPEVPVQPIGPEPVQPAQPQSIGPEPVQPAQPQPIGPEPAQPVQPQPIGPEPAQPVQPKTNGFKRILMIIGGAVVAIIVLGVIIFAFVSGTSDKLVCKSDKGNITIMYKDDTITGYTAKNITYDLDGQKEIANEIGIEEYIDQFEEWFENNTGGTCTFKNK